MALLPLLYHGTQRLRQHFACCQDWLRGPAHGDARTGLELQPVDEQELLNNPPIAPPDLPPLQITRNYSILLPHSGGWYDIAKNKEYELRIFPDLAERKTKRNTIHINPFVGLYSAVLCWAADFTSGLMAELMPRRTYEGKTL